MSAVTFNASFYLQQNPDVLAAVSRGEITAEQHFQQFGQFEGRDPNQFFDTEYYLAQNPDVLAAIANPANTSVVSAFQHFVTFGVAEGLVRRPSEAFEGFNPTTYLQSNPDLQAAFADVPAADLPNVLFQHFLTFGVNENRPGSGVEDLGTPGITLNFTSGVDTLVGSVNNDTFVAGAVDASGVPTGTPGLGLISAKDTVNGGAGFDTVVVNGGAGTLAAATFTSVEAIEFNGTTGVTADLSKASSIEEVTFSNSAAGNTVTVASANVDVVFDNVDTASNVTQAIKYVEGTAGSVEVTNGSTLGTVSFTNVATGTGTNTINTVNVASSGAAANSINAIAAGTKLETVNISGNQDLTIATLSGITTVDGSAASGDLTLTLDSGEDVTVTGGSGDDRFIFAAGLSKDDTVDGGAGSNTVVVNGNNYSSAAAAAPFNALTNIQTVEFVGGTGAVLNGATFTNASITNLLFNTGGTDVINGAGSARTYEFGTDNAGAAGFNLKAGATELNLVLAGEEGDDANVGALSVNLTGAAAGTVATVNLTSEGDLDEVGFVDTENYAAADFNNVGTVSAISGSTVNIDGSANLAIFGGDVAGTAVTAGFTNNVIVDASGFSGQLVIAGSNFAGVAGTEADTVTPVTGVNTAATNTGVDTITLGTSDARDVVVFSSELASGIIEIATPAGGTAATGAAATGNVFVDTIVNFQAGVGGDVLFFGTNLENAESGVLTDFTAVNTATQTSIDSLVGDAVTLLDAASLAANFNATQGWTAFSFQGETYALYEGSASTTDGFTNADTLVRLQGVSVADLTDDNFAF